MSGEGETGRFNRVWVGKFPIVTLGVGRYPMVAVGRGVFVMLVGILAAVWTCEERVQASMTKTSTEILIFILEGMPYSSGYFGENNKIEYQHIPIPWKSWWYQECIP
jgi:hypothetical protein